MKIPEFLKVGQAYHGEGVGPFRVVEILEDGWLIVKLIPEGRISQIWGVAPLEDDFLLNLNMVKLIRKL